MILLTNAGSTLRDKKRMTKLKIIQRKKTSRFYATEMIPLVALHMYKKCTCKEMNQVAMFEDYMYM